MIEGITNTNGLIDVAKINEGCNIIDLASESYLECAKYLESASRLLGEESLSTDKRSFQPIVEQTSNNIEKISPIIKDFTAQIRKTSTQILQSQQNNSIQNQESGDLV